MYSQETLQQRLEHVSQQIRVRRKASYFLVRLSIAAKQTRELTLICSDYRITHMYTCVYPHRFSCCQVNKIWSNASLFCNCAQTCLENIIVEILEDRVIFRTLWYEKSPDLIELGTCQIVKLCVNIERLNQTVKQRRRTIKHPHVFSFI